MRGRQEEVGQQDLTEIAGPAASLPHPGTPDQELPSSAGFDSLTLHLLANLCHAVSSFPTGWENNANMLWRMQMVTT